MKKRFFTRYAIGALLAGSLALSGCVTKDVHYRGRTFAGGDCGTPGAPVQVDARSVKGKFHGFEKEHASKADSSKALECAVQSYNAGHPIAYDIGFVEFLDGGDTPVLQEQMADVHRYLKAHAEEPMAVYVFVHGWRHNAAIDNEDVARFHTILALMKSYWRDAGEQNRRVFGIYVGWRGTALHEPGWGEKVDPIVASLTFPGRKAQSDEHALRLQAFLSNLESGLQRCPSDLTTPLVVIGHSLGGNMVLRATRPLFEQRLLASPQGAKVPGVGSLVVLLNPASELTEWMKLQRASRLHADIGEPDRASYLQPSDSDCARLSPNASAESKRRCRTEGTEWVFPPDQMPVLVSLTASEHYKKVDKGARETDEIATNTAFPLSQRVFKWPRESTDLIALGHALPVRAFRTHDELDHGHPDNRLYGLTHEAEVNEAKNETSTRYGNILKRAESGTTFCVANQRLIRDSIQQAVTRKKTCEKDPAQKDDCNHKARGRDWDQQNLWLGPALTNLRLNIRHGVVRNKCASNIKSKDSICNEIGGERQIPILGDIYDPYWNVGVHPNLIESHGLYVSQNLWCFVHGLATP